ncbi:hypothetical protein [Dickeya oryzae]
MTTMSAVDWARQAARSRWNREGFLASVVLFLTLVSIPIVTPYLWLLAISFTHRDGGSEYQVLWRLLTIAALAYALLLAIAWRARTEQHARRLRWLVGLAALLVCGLWVAPELTFHNYRFFMEPGCAGHRCTEWYVAVCLGGVGQFAAVCDRPYGVGDCTGGTCCLCLIPAWLSAARRGTESLVIAARFSGDGADGGDFYSALLDGAAQQSVGGDAGDVRP